MKLILNYFIKAENQVKYNITKSLFL